MPTTKKIETVNMTGMAFHVFEKTAEGKDKVKYQGVVLGMADETHAIVQFYEWFAGCPNTCAVVPVADMQSIAFGGTWQFYRDVEHMREWYETHPFHSHGCKE